MSKSRLEAFSDGVIAILITIMVLELKSPHGGQWSDLRTLLPTFAAYVMSFLYLGIYWNNHHHLLQMTTRINGGILWANLHLMFWLSLIPLSTAWMGNHFDPLPTAAYGGIVLLAALAYEILQIAIIAEQGPDSKLREAIGKDVKGKTSVGLYVLAIGLAFVNRWLSVAIYALVALIWLVPDQRIEAKLSERGSSDKT